MVENSKVNSLDLKAIGVLIVASLDLGILLFLSGTLPRIDIAFYAITAVISSFLLSSLFSLWSLSESFVLVSRSSIKEARKLINKEGKFKIALFQLGVESVSISLLFYISLFAS